MSPEQVDKAASEAIYNVGLALYQVTVGEEKSEIQEQLSCALHHLVKIMRGTEDSP